MRAIGIMSGTSADGVDAILLELASVETRHTPTVIDSVYRPFPDEMRRELTRPEALSMARAAELHFHLPDLYAEAVRALRGYETAVVVGMHGQTVWHRPPSHGAAVPCTLQLGSSAVLAERLGLPVVADLRAADMAWGGEGAPIVPFAHWFFTPPERSGLLVVNLGGIANVTHVAEDLDEVTAADIGPGMMIADALVSAHTAGRASFDVDGEYSRGGRILPPIVDAILEHPFFRRPLPCTTGREDFGPAFTEALQARFSDVHAADRIRSALAATATLVARAAHAREAHEILLTGGGARNPTVVELVAERAGGRVVRVAEDGAFAPNHHEPAAMALIAARTFSDLPSGLPSVTGARRSTVLGHVFRPSWSLAVP